MPNEKLKVGVIGANPTYGWSPRAHLPAIVVLPDIELVAVCTTREESARASAEKYGAAMWFDDHRAMLREADLDAVAVSVKVPEHYRPTVDAIEAANMSIPSGPSAVTSERPKRWPSARRKRASRPLLACRAGATRPTCGSRS